MKKRKLEFELVPSGCWGLSLAKIFPKKLWNVIRKYAIEKSQNKCSICGANSKVLHAHERWSYNLEKGVQKLEDVIAVCPLCHSAIHINRTFLTGNLFKAEEQYMKVNGVSYAQMKQDLKQANELNEKRSQASFISQDFTWLRKFDEENGNN